MLLHEREGEAEIEKQWAGVGPVRVGVRARDASGERESVWSGCRRRERGSETAE